MNNKFAEYKRKITIKGIANFDKQPPNIEEWKKFLDLLPKTQDVFTLSLNKYKCRMHYFDFKYKFLVNIGAFFSLISIWFSNLFVNFNNKKISKDKAKYDMIILEREVDLEDVFPNELYEEFPNYKTIKAKHNQINILDKDLKKAYKILSKKNFFKFEYRLLALKELTLHSNILLKYNPKATVVYINERNVFSPILKETYEKKNKELISFMHGENLFELIKSYMAFSRYYIWDEDQVDMFKNDMYCTIDRYIKYIPKKLSKKYQLKEKYTKDLTYYISANSKKSIERLGNIIKQLEKHNITLIVRPHPRMTDIEELKSNIEDIYIESFNVRVSDSIENSEYIVGSATTVLTEAYYGGKKILIDDVTDKEVFDSLINRKYLMLNKLKEERVQLFSEYLKEKAGE